MSGFICFHSSNKISLILCTFSTIFASLQSYYRIVNISLNDGRNENLFSSNIRFISCRLKLFASWNLPMFLSNSMNSGSELTKSMISSIMCLRVASRKLFNPSFYISFPFSKILKLFMGFLINFLNAFCIFSLFTFS